MGWPWRLSASSDLEEHHRRLEALDPEAARAFAASVLDAIEPLRTFPFVGPIAQDLRPAGTYRSVPCEDGRVLYRVEAEVIWILRIWIGRRDPRDLIPE